MPPSSSSGCAVTMSRLARVCKARSHRESPAAPRSTSTGSASAEACPGLGAWARSTPNQPKTPASPTALAVTKRFRTFRLPATGLNQGNPTQRSCLRYIMPARAGVTARLLLTRVSKGVTQHLRTLDLGSLEKGVAYNMLNQRTTGRRLLVAGWCVITVASHLAGGQTQSINGTVRGRVTDPAAAAIPGAQVTVKNAATGFERSQSTGEDGFYVLPNLPLGTYTVTVQKQGFEAQRRTGVILNAGAEVTLDGQLAVGSVSTIVEVTGGAPVVDPAQVNIGRTIGPEEVDNLPLTSRNPYNFIIFQPGVSGHPNPELGIPRTINTNGLLDRINYQMDGMVNTQSDRIGLRLFPIGDIFVKEVQTVSNSFNPEFGWTSGNVYNVISNNGTNSFHGLFQWIRRWQDATAYPYFANKSQPKPNLQLQDFSTNAGGRIIKDKLFFFGS